MNRHVHQRFFSAFILAVLGALCFGIWGCAGAPRSIEQIETMPDAQWGSWLVRVELVAKLATKQYVNGEPGRAEKAHAFAVGLQVVSLQEPDLVEIAKAAGIDEDLARFIILDAQAMIDERGGWPKGPRLQELVGTIAAGIELGSTP